MYIKRCENIFAILSLYVDDIQLVAISKEFVKIIKDLLYLNFDMKDIGEATYILGVKNFRNSSRKHLAILQELYIKTILERSNMAECKLIDTPIAKEQYLSLDRCPKTP